MEFSAPRIAAHHRAITRQHAQFEAFFGANAITPARVTYENLVADPAAVLARLGPHLGVPDLPYVPDRLQLARQAGPLNEDWRARFEQAQPLARSPA